MYAQLQELLHRLIVEMETVKCAVLHLSSQQGQGCGRRCRTDAVLGAGTAGGGDGSSFSCPQPQLQVQERLRGLHYKQCYELSILVLAEWFLPPARPKFMAKA